MAKYKVAYTVTKVETEEIEAKNFEDAKDKWESEGMDAELFYIEDENGKQVVYD